jgi:hypothetical protein
MDGCISKDERTTDTAIFPAVAVDRSAIPIFLFKSLHRRRVWISDL